MRGPGAAAAAFLPIWVGILLVSGCGGGGSRERIAAQANSECARAYSRLSLVNNLTTAQNTRAKAAIDKSLLADLGRLDPPDDGREDFDRFVAARRRLVRADAAALDALTGPPGSGALAAYRRAAAASGSASDDAEVAARDYGLEVCSGDDLGDVQISDAPALSELPDPGSPPRVSGASIVPGSAFAGTWSGTVDQYGPGATHDSYPTAMRIASAPAGDGSNGTITYPSFPCGGRVRIVRAADSPLGSPSGGAASLATRYVLREYIGSGAGKCTGGGMIIADLQGDQLGWRWRRGGVNVIGVLTRRGATSARRSFGLDRGDLALLPERGLRGEITQYGPGERVTHYPLVVKLRATGSNPGKTTQAGTTFNPEDGCRGSLTLVAESGRSYVFRETPPNRHFADRCGYAVRFELVPWRWGVMLRGLTRRPPSTEVGVLAKALDPLAAAKQD
ncbi:MAG: hypothetical protein U0R52_01005 [Solirubrobacterales bacterium]